MWEPVIMGGMIVPRGSYNDMIFLRAYEVLWYCTRIYNMKYKAQPAILLTFRLLLLTSLPVYQFIIPVYQFITSLPRFTRVYETGYWGSGVYIYIYLINLVNLLYPGLSQLILPVNLFCCNYYCTVCKLNFFFIVVLTYLL